MSSIIQKNHRLKKLCSMALASITTVSFLSVLIKPDVVMADWTKTRENTKLGVTQIAPPAIPKDLNDAWKGSYVYFGNFQGEPIRFRVLTTSTDEYSDGNTMLLDSDKILTTMKFKEFNDIDSSFTGWEQSIPREYLNGEFLDDSFTSTEKKALAENYVIGGKEYEKDTYFEYEFRGTVSLTGEKVFLLEPGDVTNPDYGYTDITGFVFSTKYSGYVPDDILIPNRYKYYGDEPTLWWLRSFCKNLNVYSSGVWSNGIIYAPHVDQLGGVAPAINIDLESILFSSLIKGTSNTAKAEYKLTIKDPDMSIKIPSGSAATKSGNKLTIPYKATGKGISQISVLITDKEYNNDSAAIKYYGKLSEGEYKSEGTLTFTIPSDINGTMGKDYHVYILAEDINGEKESDYASEPYEIKANEESAEISFSDFVERLYVVALGRASEPEGKAFWSEHVGNGDLTGAQCANEFLLSKEFNDRKLTDEQFLTVLYETFFNRKASDDPDGFNFWMNSLKTQGRDVVVDCFINSTEWCNVCATYGVKSGATRAKATIASANATAFATRLYTECLGREPEADGLKFWSLGLTNLELTGSAAAHEFFFCKEFNDHNFDNKELITRMYRTFMGREPDDAGMTFWLDSMSKGMTKQQVFDCFVSSPEFTQICKDYAIERG